MPRSRAHVTTGCRGEKPGDATTTSGSNSDSATGTASSDPVHSRAPITGSRRSYSSSAFSVTTRTSAPSSASVSATEKPVTDSPSTVTHRSIEPSWFPHAPAIL